MRPRNVLTDEQYGKLSRRLDDFKRRVVEGTLPFELVMPFVQRGSEGRLGRERVEVIKAVSSCEQLSQKSVLAQAADLGLDCMTEQEGRRELLCRKDHWVFVILQDSRDRVAGTCSIMFYNSNSEEVKVDRGLPVSSELYSLYAQFLFMRRA